VSAPRARVWFLDTSSLLSMAVDKDIEAAVLDETGNDRVVIIDIVQDELTHRAGIPETAALAKTALAGIRPDWPVMDTTRYVTLEDVQSAQEDVADGRNLTDDWQHWAESTIIALARRSATTGLTSKILLNIQDPPQRGLRRPTGRLHRAAHARRQYSLSPPRTRPEQPHDRRSSRCTRRNAPSSRAWPSSDRQRLRRPHRPRTWTRRKALTLRHCTVGWSERVGPGAGSLRILRRVRAVSRAPTCAVAKSDPVLASCG